MAPTYTYQLANPQRAGHRSVGTRMKQFWQRTTDGLELNQLWNQFRIDTRTSYRLYSRGIDSTCRKGTVLKRTDTRQRLAHAVCVVDRFPPSAVVRRSLDMKGPAQP